VFSCFPCFPVFLFPCFPVFLFSCFPVFLFSCFPVFLFPCLSLGSRVDLFMFGMTDGDEVLFIDVKCLVVNCSMSPPYMFSRPLVVLSHHLFSLSTHICRWETYQSSAEEIGKKQGRRGGTTYALIGSNGRMRVLSVFTSISPSRIIAPVPSHHRWEERGQRRNRCKKVPSDRH